MHFLGCSRCVGMGGIAAILVGVFCSVLSAAPVSAYTISVTTSGSQTINVKPDLNSGSTATNIGEDNITVATTCRAGYNFSISSSVNNNNLYLDGDSSNNTSGTYFTPADGTTSLANSSNKWGYLMSSSTPSSSSTFLPVPVVSNPTMLKTAAETASSSDISDNFSIYYGVSVASGLSGGNYKMIKDGSDVDGAIIYYATMDATCNDYTIAYNANGGTGTMSSQSASPGVAITLRSNTFTPPTDQVFLNWNTESDGSGISYEGGQSVTDIASPGQTITLYAQWGYPMQGFTPTQCQSLASSSNITLVDLRDNKKYTARYINGNCWMTQNLAFTGNTLDSTTSNVASTYTASSPLSITWNDLKTSSNTCNGTAGYDNACNHTPDATDLSTVGLTAEQIGVWYNFAGTSAMTITGSSNSDDMYYDICPKGWSIPNYSQASSITSYRSAFAPVYSYYWDNGTLTPVPGSGSSGQGRWWTSNPASVTYRTVLRYISNNLSLSGTLSRSFGQSVRCVRNSRYTVVFNANGGTGTMNEQLINTGTATALTTNTFTRSGYEFSGWNTAADGSGISYTDGQSVTDIAPLDGTITLYAQWRKPLLYNKVAAQSKGKQTNDTNSTTGIQTNPTAPTSSVTVSPNSGVYEYDSSVFGADTDGTKSDSTKATIYYYRGILDSYGNTNTNGSAGLSDAYPNYVILSANGTKSTSDTCWRIIRTTGSGGVKMIYNGLWTGSTCANATTAAMISSPVATSTFDGAASNTTTSRQIVRVGYTYNNTYANTNTTSSVAFDTVMGGNTAFSVNSTSSTIKGNVETWFNNTLSDFDDANMFEANAGYCNDRLGYTSGTASTLTTSIRPYTTSTNSGATYNSYFAGYQRNLSTTQSPSLGCSSARSTVDVYSTDTSKGGNGQLGAPVGLLTADEASFAGSGSNTASQGSGYSANSYLKNGSAFWTMTPYYRYSRYAYNIAMNTNGYLGSSRIDTANGIRPVVSLKEGTAIDSGTGIATDPWVIKGPKTMQSATSADCGQEMVDTRDGNTYTTATIGSLCWMTKNLDLPGGTTLSSADTNVPDDYSTTTTGFTNNNTLPASSTIGFSSNTTAYVYNSGSTTCSSSSPCYSYYSWLAATAGYTASSGSVSYDICPKGWRLPTQAELTTLKNTYTTGTTLTASPFLGVYAGLYSSGQFYDGGSSGFYWSSTAYDSNNARFLYFNSYSAGVNYRVRSDGSSIRCVLNNTTPTTQTYIVSYDGPSSYDAMLYLNSVLVQDFYDPNLDNMPYSDSFSANNGDTLRIETPSGNLYINNTLTYTFTGSQSTYDITVTTNIDVLIQNGNVYVTTS